MKSKISLVKYGSCWVYVASWHVNKNRRQYEQYVDEQKGTHPTTPPRIFGFLMQHISQTTKIYDANFSNKQWKQILIVKHTVDRSHHWVGSHPRLHTDHAERFLIFIFVDFLSLCQFQLLSIWILILI